MVSIVPIRLSRSFLVCPNCPRKARDKTELSDRAIAKLAKVSDKTVTSVRHQMERRSEIPNVSIKTDAAGRLQPAAKPRTPLFNEEVNLPVSQEPKAAHV